MSDAALYHARDAPLVCESDAAVEQLEPERGAVLLKKGEVRAGAGAGVEQLDVRSSRGRLCHERSDKSLEATKPEVPLLGLEGAFEQRIHGLGILRLRAHDAVHFCA